MTTDMTTTTTPTTTERGGTNSAVATWAGGWRCDVVAGGFSLIVDEPVDIGGTGMGPMPTDLLMASLSSCYLLALTWAAGRRGVVLPDLEVTATGTYEGQKFTSLVLTVKTSLSAEQLAPLIEPAKRVCYVSNTFAHAPAIEVQVA